MCIGEVMLMDEQDVVNRQRSEVHSQKTIKLMCEYVILCVFAN